MVAEQEHDSGAGTVNDGIGFNGWSDFAERPDWGQDISVSVPTGALSTVVNTTVAVTAPSTPIVTVSPAPAPAVPLQSVDTNRLSNTNASSDRAGSNCACCSGSDRASSNRACRSGSHRAGSNRTCGTGSDPASTNRTCRSGSHRAGPIAPAVPVPTVPFQSHLPFRFPPCRFQSHLPFRFRLRPGCCAASGCAAGSDDTGSFDQSDASPGGRCNATADGVDITFWNVFTIEQYVQHVDQHHSCRAVGASDHQTDG